MPTPSPGAAGGMHPGCGVRGRACEKALTPSGPCGGRVNQFVGADGIFRPGRESRLKARPLAASMARIRKRSRSIRFAWATDLSRRYSSPGRPDVTHHFDEKMGGWVPTRDEWLMTTIPGIFAAGDGAGIGGKDTAFCEGQLAALGVAQTLGKKLSPEKVDQTRRTLVRQNRFAEVLNTLFPFPAQKLDLLSDETFICRCEGVQVKDCPSDDLGGGHHPGHPAKIDPRRDGPLSRAVLRSHPGRHPIPTNRSTAGSTRTRHPAPTGHANPPAWVRRRTVENNQPPEGFSSFITFRTSPGRFINKRINQCLLST